jgi:hypothetical protein
MTREIPEVNAHGSSSKLQRLYAVVYANCGDVFLHKLSAQPSREQYQINVGSRTRSSQYRLIRQLFPDAPGPKEISLIRSICSTLQLL